MSQTCCSTSTEVPADVSGRVPVLFLFGGALKWLLAGLALSLLAAVKLQLPGLLAGCEWFTYGRVEAAARTALIFGFASQLGLGVAFWLLTRTGGAKLAAPGFSLVAILFWNLALVLGVVGILFEGTNGIPLLELPRQLAPTLGLALGVLALVGFATFAKRQPGSSTPSQWYVVAALLAFPVLYLTAQITLLFFPARGVVQAIIAGWFGQGVELLWLAPLALASLYHFIPESTGGTVRSPALAPLGFWSWVIFASWMGAVSLVGGPLPAWVITVSVAACVLLLIPVTLISLNLTISGPAKCTTTKYFALLAGASFTLGGVALALTSPRCAQAVLHFTQFNVALRELFLFGFVSPALFAAVYAIVPKLAGREFPCRLTPKAHFGLTVLGLGVLLLASGVGGWKQGWLLADPKTDFATVSASLRPWLCLHTLGLGIFAVGQLALVANCARLIFECVKPLREPALALFTETRPAVAGK
ncbi:MAG TPA: cbb3-type cytochrome c oxidase subunit I [Candidatus Limnocylindria bacterium]|nr:cbb3-type cytochrome c oxidase subunit I [Candidatus Limnocylindria bacterium]